MTYDINILDTGSRRLGFINGAGSALTGFAKAAQQFVTTLLTERGSKLWQPDSGTALVTAIRLGQPRTSFELQAAATTAIHDAQQELLALYGDATPDDEYIVAAGLVRYELAAPGLRLYIKLTNRENHSAVVVVPVVPEVETDDN